MAFINAHINGDAKIFLKNLQDLTNAKIFFKDLQDLRYKACQEGIANKACQEGIANQGFISPSIVSLQYLLVGGDRLIPPDSKITMAGFVNNTISKITENSTMVSDDISMLVYLELLGVLRN